METAKVSLSPHQQKSSKQEEALSRNCRSPRSYHKRSVCSLFTMAHLQTWKAMPLFSHAQKHMLTIEDFLQEESQSKAGSPPSRWRAVTERGRREPVW